MHGEAEADVDSGGKQQRRALVVAAGLLLAVGLVAFGAAQGVQDGEGVRAELLYIDSYGEKQHVITTADRLQALAGDVPGLSETKSSGGSKEHSTKASRGKKGRGQEHVSSGEKALEDALREHELREKASERLRKLAHKNPQLWEDKDVSDSFCVYPSEEIL